MNNGQCDEKYNVDISKTVKYQLMLKIITGYICILPIIELIIFSMENINITQDIQLLAISIVVL